MANYIPGTYEGAARGYRGKLVVNVTVTEDKISDIQIVKHKEVRGLALGSSNISNRSNSTTDYRIPIT